MSDKNESKIVDSHVYALSDIFSKKYRVDFYQREYVWREKQIEDLISDLSNEFLKNYKPGDKPNAVQKYDPYFMGEMVVSNADGEYDAIIDGQQRITTFTLLLIYLLRNYKTVPGFPTSSVEPLIYSDSYGEKLFCLDIPERNDCMESLFNQGSYDIKDEDSLSVQCIIDRYSDIGNFWNDQIDESNIVHFTYWLLEKVMFSKVWTNSDDFAYVIFETMNDRGLPLTQVEMLRSYLLANIAPNNRNKAIDTFDDVVKRLLGIKLSSKSKAEYEFFKVYFRGHYATGTNQTKDGSSDFEKIGNQFHRWVRESESKLGLKTSDDFEAFLDRISYYSKKYDYIYSLIQSRDANNYLYLIVNNDYGFTLQPMLILAAIKYNDSDDVVNEKIKIVSKYLAKVLTWRVWHHWLTSQSKMEDKIFNLCKEIRDMSTDELNAHFMADPIKEPETLDDATPMLNQTNKPKIKVLLSLITAIVGSNSGEPCYMLNSNEPIEVEHIWADHFERHTNEFASKEEFANMRNSIGDLLVLPKSFNASYKDATYEDKVIQYFSQNILAQTLHSNKYTNNPGFIKFKDNSKLNFKSYEHFNKNDVVERADLYREILKWNWRELDN